MANDLTRKLWARKMPAPRKLVLIYLADRANSEHRTWPSVATICDETGLGRSTVFRALEELRDAGYVSHRQRWNDSNVYQVFDPQSQSGTGPRAGLTPSQSGTVIPSEPSPVVRAQAMDFAGWPAEPSPASLAGWLEVRKRKRAPVTPVVMQRMGSELTQAAAKGWTVDQVLDECAWKGWQGFRADWLEPRNPGHDGPETRNPAGQGGAGGTTQRRMDYAQGSGGGKPRVGGAIDRVLGNARARAESATTAAGPGPDCGDDDVCIRP